VKFFRQVLNFFSHHSAQDKQLIQIVSSITGHHPLNLRLFWLATLHSSAGRTDKYGHKLSNERLEYLGDAILGAVVAEYLFKRYPFKDEGFLTEIRSRIVNRESLNLLGRKMGLDQLLIYDQQKKHGHAYKSLYGDALEAFIGAVYMDRRYHFCKKFIINRLIEPNFDIDKLISINTNFKSQLIEWAQKSGKSIRFDSHELEETGKLKEFEVEVFSDEERLALGFGPNKKKAEQSAARKALERITGEEL